MDAAVYVANARTEDHHWWFEGRRRILRELIAAHVHPRATGAPRRRILDVGCGTGGMFPLLSELGAVEGADGSPDARAFATARFPTFAVHEAQLPHELPATRGADGVGWDLITAFDVIEHVDDPIGSLRAMRERLAPAGQIAVTVPAYEALWSDHDVAHHHKRRYRRAQLCAELAAAGLRATYTTHFNTWLLPAIAGVRFASRLVHGAAPREASAAPSAADSHDSGNLRDTPRLVNRALTWLFASERAVLRYAPLPAGVSIFAIAEPAR